MPASFSSPAVTFHPSDELKRAWVSLQDEGFFIVCNGLVRVRYDVWQGTSQTYFLGTGGMFGLFSALTGGPCLFHLTATAFHCHSRCLGSLP